MSLPTLGKNTLVTEITNISNHGIRLYSNGKEFFMSYRDFPWFKDTCVEKIINVREISPGHFYWADLDVDLSTEIIEHPERFPMLAKQSSD